MSFGLGLGLETLCLGLSLGLETLSLGLGLHIVLEHQHQSATSINCIHITVWACSYRSLLLNFDAGLSSENECQLSLTI